MDKIHTEHGIFTANEELGLTAEEVYQKWLENRNKPQPPTRDERIEALEQAMLDLILGGMK